MAGRGYGLVLGCLVTIGALSAARSQPVVGVVHASDGGQPAITVVRWPAGADPEVRTVGPFGARDVVATVDGEDLYVAAGGGARWRFERHRPFTEGRPAQRLDGLPHMPTALTARAGRLYVGGPARVDVVDFRSVQPTLRAGYVASDLPWRKAVDAFAWSGDTLVAVDDIVTPKYAFLLPIVDGVPTGGRTVRLPNGVNESYTDAAAHGAIVVMTTRYGHMGGGGHRLFVTDLRVPPVTPKAASGADATPWREPGWDEPRLEVRTLEERHGWRDTAATGPKASDTLLAGKEPTRWRAVALPDERHALLCAEGRGVLVVPLPEGEGATTFDTGDPCLDLAAAGDALFALTGRPRPRRILGNDPAARRPTHALVRLRWDASAARLAVDGRVDLDGRPYGLARGLRAH